MPDPLPEAEPDLANRLIAMSRRLEHLAEDGGHGPHQLAAALRTIVHELGGVMTEDGPDGGRWWARQLAGWLQLQVAELRSLPGFPPSAVAPHDFDPREA